MKKTLEDVVQSTNSESEHQPKFSYLISAVPFFGWAKAEYTESYIVARSNNNYNFKERLGRHNKVNEYTEGYILARSNNLGRYNKASKIGFYSSFGAYLIAGGVLEAALGWSLTAAIGIGLGWTALAGGIYFGARKLGKQKANSESNQYVQE